MYTPPISKPHYTEIALNEKEVELQVFSRHFLFLILSLLMLNILYQNLEHRNLCENDISVVCVKH